MKRNSLLILSALVILFAACGKKGGKSGLLVPKDAAIVVHINSKSLTSKLSWEEIRQTNWFREMHKESTDTMSKQLLDDPASSGIDTKEDLVFYMKKQGRGSYLIFEGSLTDAAAFEKLLNKINEKQDVKKDGDFSYMQGPNDDDGIVLWNKSKFAYINNAPLSDMTAGFPGKRGSGDRYSFLNDSLRIFGKEALNLKAADNLDSDSRFADLVKDGSDMHLWVNMPSGVDQMGEVASFLKLEILMEGNVSAASLNFDNGKIGVKSKTYYNDQMSKLLEANKPGPLSTEMINRIPSGNVAGVIAFNYPPKGVQELLKLINADGVANAYLSKMGYSIDEFVKANKGDVLLAVSDIAMVTKQDTLNYGNGMKPYVYTSTKPDLKVLFATSVNDKAAFDKLVTIAWEATKGMTDKFPPISYKLENNWFAASNSPEFTDKFLAGGSSKLPFVDKISGHPFGMYVDLNKIVNAMGSGATDSIGKEMLALNLQTWQDITATGGDYKDKAVNFELEVNFVDKNTNSLKQLNQFADKIYLLTKKRKEAYARSWERTEDAPAAVMPAN